MAAIESDVKEMVESGGRVDIRRRKRSWIVFSGRDLILCIKGRAA
jgi:hypothetical protein